MIIGFLGKAGSGKSTACAFLQKEFNATTMAFAEPLKAMCLQTYGEAFGVPTKAFYGSQEEKNASLIKYGLPGWTGRKILQHIGTEGFREVHAKVWARLGVKNALRYQEQFVSNLQMIIAFSDARFHSEAEELHAVGGIVVRLLRNPAGDTNEGIKGHPSEMEMDSIEANYTIDNRTNTLFEFKTQVIELVTNLRNK